MNISWVIANNAQLDPTVNLQQLKDIGSAWGGWQTWRVFQTDNVVCYDMVKAEELIKRSFYTTCNFYIPNFVYTKLDCPAGVKVYEGKFQQELDNYEDIVAMHLASSINNIVLLLGFDLTEQKSNQDQLIKHKEHNYRNLVKQAIVQNSTVQWVIIDHPGEIMDGLKNIDNLQQDTLNNILS